MLKTLGIVQACFPSPRFHSNLGRRLGGQSLLGFVVRRATDCQQLDGVIVVAGDADQQRLVHKLVPSDVPVFCSNEPKAIARFLSATEQYPAEAVVRIRGDNPFVDPSLIDRLVVAAESEPQCDYASYGTRDGRPAVLSQVGLFAEWFRVKSLRKAAKSRTASDDCDHVTEHILSRPDKFNIRLIPAPEQIDREDVRLTVDIEEDWDHALAIFDALGPEQLDWQRIAGLLDHQPALRSRMAALNRACRCG